MDLPDDDLSTSSALVVDGNPTSRSILVSQLRDFGMGTVVQSARLTDARRQLEYRKFDVVLCEHHFSGEASSGQDLLDDLRRNQLLPFSTVFIMVTGEATYTKVAEAAESALDGYLLKPHKATQLGERLRQARIRKASLLEIFTAIEAQDFETAANLCLKRFVTRGKFWLYAARVGAELLLRVGKYDQAQKLYQAVVDAKTLPWAKLGIARALLDEGQTAKAVSTLENLIKEDPGFTDAYDVMGRAQFEQGRFDAALQTYKLASTLTPSSITRMQNLGMMSYFAGNLQQAEQHLDRTVRMGLDSKMFDCQTLVLLAFVRLGNGDTKGLQRCRDDFVKLLDRHQDSERHRRLASMVDALHLIAQRQYAQVLQVVRELCSHVKDPAFDYESASNLVSLLSLLANKAIQLEEVDAVIDALGLRFAGTRALAELLAGAAHAHAPYADRLRAAHAQILKLAENAMTLSLAGDPKAAVNNLVRHGTSTLSGKLIETAYLVLHRYADKMHDVHDLAEHVHTLRSRYSTHITRASLGEQKRQPGGLTLRIDSTAGKRDAPISLTS
jgi:tetratricopeptide (TPR) repeat protein